MRRSTVLLLLASATVVLASASWQWSRSWNGGDSSAGAEDESDGDQRHVGLEGPGPALHGTRPADSGIPDRGSVLVRVSGFNSLGLPSVRLRIERVDGTASSAVTDSRGEVRLADELLNGTTRVGVSPALAVGFPAGAVRIRGPYARVHLPRGIPITMQFVDAETGVQLRGVRWAVGENSSAATLLDATTQVVWAATASVLPHMTFCVSPPAGYVAWDGRAAGEDICPSFKVDLSRISREAKSLVVRYPLRREARVFIRTLERAQRRPHRFVAWGVKVGQAHSIAPLAEFKLGSRERVRGIPYFQGQEFSLLVTDSHTAFWWLPKGALEDPPAQAAMVGERPSATDGVYNVESALIVRAKLPPSLDDEVSLAVSFQGYLVGAKTIAWDVHGDAWDLPSAGLQLDVWPPAKESGSGGVGTLVLHAERRSGEPAGHARVWVAGKSYRTDAGGMVRCSNVPSGRQAAILDEAGMVLTTVHVLVTANKEGKLRLREGVGGGLSVVVVDEDGRVLPYAALKLVTPSQRLQARWVSRSAGVQRLDTFSDHLGMWACHGVDPGRMTVTATWAGLEGTSTVQIVDGKDAHVQVVLQGAR